MDTEIHDDKTFENIDYSEKQLFNREYNNCNFSNCNFQKAELKRDEFIDCVFNSCNFSLAALNDSGIKNVSFTDCKLMGIDFSKCNSFLFTVSFNNCILDYSSFAKKKRSEERRVGKECRSR